VMLKNNWDIRQVNNVYLCLFLYKLTGIILIVFAYANIQFTGTL
jgi:hypothetical protein